MQIGVITKPQALKGQFRVKPTKVLFEDFKDLKEVSINGKTYEVEKVIFRDTFVIMKVKGIDDISEVERLRNVPIMVEDGMEEELDDDEYYVDDLIGCDVVDDKGVMIGSITAVNSYGGASVITVTDGDKEVMFPHARGVILSVDVATKKVAVDRKIFEEISL